MGRDKAQRTPKAGGAVPVGRSVRTGGNPASYDNETLCWQIRGADWDHPDWGWSHLEPDIWTQDIRSRADARIGITVAWC